ncbi:glycosyltransferase family 4 protein [Nocardioides sp.]|uniref:glycosyltransferase family 4 protein n=1 Tax=Nocardioides sp. TaxID=35761 RepID=UPI003783AC57
MSGGQRVVQVLTQDAGGPVDHAVDVAVGLAGRGLDSHVLGPWTPRTETAREAGVTWHELEVASKRDVRGAARAGRRLLALRPDVVHLQDRRAGWLGRGLAPALRSRRSGVGVVYTLHGVADGLSDLVAGNARAGVRRRRDRALYLTGERLVSRWGRCRVVVPSRAVARYAVEQVGLPPGVVDVVPNGVVAERYARARPDGVPPRAVWVGVLAPVKRVGLLLDAVAEVPQVRLRVVGDGPLRDEVADRCARPDLADRVELTGWVAEPATCLADADVFVLTSAAENCPIALLEAMASGLPVLSTAVGGVPEVVRDGVDGLLVPADDPTALTAALRTLADDAGLRARLGASARRRILDGYTLEHCLDRLLVSYDASREG